LLRTEERAESLESGLVGAQWLLSVQECAALDSALGGRVSSFSRQVNARTLFSSVPQR